MVSGEKETRAWGIHLSSTDVRNKPIKLTRNGRNVLEGSKGLEKSAGLTGCEGSGG